MKSLLLLLACYFFPGCGQSDKSQEKDKTTVDKTENRSNDKEKPSGRLLFDIKAAKIEFKYTGGPEEGTETLYFDDYGEIAVLTFDKKSGFGRNHQTIIWKDKKSTMLNHEKKSVSTSPFRVKATEPAGLAEVSEQDLAKMGYEKLAGENIAGKPCEVWFNSKMNIKYWLWKKIDLKLENQGVYTKEATSVEEISMIPASLMEIPGDYK